MTTQALYAWKNPLSFDSHLDHTWVTNYVVPSTAGQPNAGVPLRISNWFCWGEYHAQSTGQLSTAMADPSVASAVSPANVPALPDGAKHWEPSSTSGAIVYYGLDGVCHNVANQVLSATGSATDTAVTVQGANGYALSTFFFTTYGLNSATWDQIIQDAGLNADYLAPDQFPPFMAAAGLSDDEQAKVTDIRTKAHGKLIDLRGEVTRGEIDNFYPRLAAYAVEILLELVVAIGLKKFKAVFGDVSTEDAQWLLPEGYTD